MVVVEHPRRWSGGPWNCGDHHTFCLGFRQNDINQTNKHKILGHWHDHKVDMWQGFVRFRLRRRHTALKKGPRQATRQRQVGVRLLRQRCAQLASGPTTPHHSSGVQVSPLPPSTSPHALFSHGSCYMRKFRLQIISEGTKTTSNATHSHT